MDAKRVKVFIYRNLNQEGHTYSIKLLEGPLKGKVVGYANGLVLENCELRVSQAGRKRVLLTKQRNVHAGIVGGLVAVTGYKTRIHNAGMDFEFYSEEAWAKRYNPGVPVVYNPFLYESFVVKGTTSPILKSNHVMIIHNRVEAYFNPEGKTLLK